MRKGYYRVHMHHHRPWLGFVFVALAVMFVLKALPIILPLLLIFGVWMFVRHGVCEKRFDFAWQDSSDEKRKRKNDDWDRWDDDEPIIV